VGVIGQKHRLLDELLKKYDVTFEGSIAVGDSEGDISMLEKVARPIAFNPSQKLFDEALAQSWPIVIERKNVMYNLEPHHGQYLLAQTNVR